MKRRKEKKTACIALIAAFITGCGGTTTGNPLVEDTSASGAVAAVIGGALSGSSANGTLSSAIRQRHSWAGNWVPEAQAATVCPSFLTSGSGCTSSGSTMWLSYAACQFSSGYATWTGTQALTMSSGSASCGSFPNPGANGSLIRQFVLTASSTIPTGARVTTAYGTTLVIDQLSANLANFDGATIATIANGGYGSKVTFDASGARSSLTLAQRVYSVGLFDHSVTGTVSVSESPAATSRTVSGSVAVYYNGTRVIGTTTLTNLGHTDSCCLPTSGTLRTSFSAGAHVAPTPLGMYLVGKSETLTFTGCGTATYVNYKGESSDVALSQCM